ncbi:transcriptional regulator GlxA family with amidase domain [Natronocella acetinitrilica]|uniref:Transcriptional regulator GlxA family with amidase domain n=1 Tax=Natronocella acetinitrilica TaxID=414046 RepID=A0AAE3G2M9_9GAMM|nr:GlxA family transcriptional regulator [Natronocella acetinitrilica]MCP1673586.1 transcriptional regulator GlxA family with amidase domain [Natronocella acetinitrilica]
MARQPGNLDAPLRVGLILQECFTLNAFAGFIDCLRLAADKGGRSRPINCAWQIMGESAITASCGMRVVPDTDMTDPRAFDYIAVCGGNAYLDPREGRGLHSYLRQAASESVRLVGICTGTFTLARAGLMNGYRACVHWNVYDDFREEFPHIRAVPDRLFLDAGARITCAGSSGATDLALHLVRRHCGADKAAQAIRHMMLQEARPASHPQAHFYADLADVRDSRVRRAVHFMEQSLNEKLTTAQIAAHVNVSSRQLERVFHAALGVAPLSYFRDMRLRYSRWLLQHSEAHIAEIAAEVGFADGAHFARAFRGRYGQPPHAARSQTTSMYGAAAADAPRITL